MASRKIQMYQNKAKKVHKQWRNYCCRFRQYDAIQKGKHNFPDILRQDMCYIARQLFKKFHFANGPVYYSIDRLEFKG